MTRRITWWLNNSVILPQKWRLLLRRMWLQPLFITIYEWTRNLVILACLMAKWAPDLGCSSCILLQLLKVYSMICCSQRLLHALIRFRVEDQWGTFLHRVFTNLLQALVRHDVHFDVKDSHTLTDGFCYALDSRPIHWVVEHSPRLWRQVRWLIVRL